MIFDDIFGCVRTAVTNPAQAWKLLKTRELRLAAIHVAYGMLVGAPYYWLIVDIPDNTEVIDIGAFCGESALYFAINDHVSKVIAYEASKEHYQIAKSAIEETPLAKKIELHNLMVSGNSGMVRFTKSGKGSRACRTSARAREN